MQKLTINSKTQNYSCFIISEDTEITYCIKDYNHDKLVLLLYVDSLKPITIIEKGNIESSDVEINYIDICQTKVILSKHYDLNMYSNLHINNYVLASNEKDYLCDVYHVDKSSFAYITTTIVSLDDNKFKFDIVGNILKDAIDSKHFQKTKLLTCQSNSNCKVIPTLNIDCNEVEAGHSLSVGIIEKEMMYYMQSKGISKKDCLKLIISSYLMFDQEKFLLFENGNELYNKVFERVNELCLN